MPRKEIERLRTDIVFFARCIGYDLSKKQIHFAKSAIKNRHTIACFARQRGKSLTLSIIIIWSLIFRKNMYIGVYSPTENQTLGVIYAQVRELFDNEPLKTLRPKVMEYWNRKGVINMKNGNKLRCFTANPTSNVRGFSPSLIIIDESQDIINEKYYADILPSGSAIKNGVKTHIVEAGTPRSRNHFFEALQDAREYSDDEFYDDHRAVAIYQPWWETKHLPWHDQSIIDKARLEMPRSHFEAEYECKFAPDIGYAFSYDDILVCSAEKERQFKRVPTHEDGYYFAGIDLGKQRDHSVLSIFKYENQDMVIRGETRFIKYRQVYLKKFPLDTLWDYILEDMIDVMKFYQPDFFIADEGHVGLMAYEQYFVRLPWPSQPWKFSLQSKIRLIHAMQRLIEDHSILLFDDESQIREFKKLKEDRAGDGAYPKYKADDGEHDDQVWAACMAIMAGKIFWGDDDNPGGQEIAYEVEESVLDAFFEGSRLDGGVMVDNYDEDSIMNREMPW